MWRHIGKDCKMTCLKKLLDIIDMLFNFLNEDL